MKEYQPKHMRGDHDQPNKHGEIPMQPERNEPVSPLGTPFPDPQGEGEYAPAPGGYVPVPGEANISHIAPNGAVIRNPWSEQPEIKPDYEYTSEKEDLNLLIM